MQDDKINLEDIQNAMVKVKEKCHYPEMLIAPPTIINKLLVESGFEPLIQKSGVVGSIYGMDIVSDPSVNRPFIYDNGIPVGVVVGKEEPDIKESKGKPKLCYNCWEHWYPESEEKCPRCYNKKLIVDEVQEEESLQPTDDNVLTMEDIRKAMALTESTKEDLRDAFVMESYSKETISNEDYDKLNKEIRDKVN